MRQSVIERINTFVARVTSKDDEVSARMKRMVIGYGNPLRRDDGLGWVAVQALSKQDMPELRCIHTDQLLPEMTYVLQDADQVMFIDASVEGVPGEVRCRPVYRDQHATPAISHHVSPEDLLTLAHVLYGATPAAWLWTVTGEDFGFGEGLSDTVQAALDDLLTQLA